MDCIRTYGSILLLACVSLLLTACAGMPPVRPTAIPPEIQFGPELDVLPVKASNDLITTLLDRQGNAHVFIAAASTKEVYHVVVSSDGSVQRELVETDRLPSHISAAFDSHARLHLLLDDTELVREETGWKTSADTPWGVTGIKAGKPEIVQGNNGLIRIFLVNGKEVGARGRWEWYAFGGYGAGIIWPWHSGSEKLVIVPEAAVAEPYWYVLDPQDNLDISSSLLAADRKGNLYVVYTASRSGLTQLNQPRYAQISLKPAQPCVEQDSTTCMNTSKRLYPIKGSAIPMSGEDLRRRFDYATAAADPESGNLLIVSENETGTSQSISHTQGQWHLPYRLPLSSFFVPKLASAGGDAFHLITLSKGDVLYLQYARGHWSAPLELGKCGVVSSFGSAGDAIGLASNGNNRAFAVWPARTGIVGLWVKGPAVNPAMTAGMMGQQQEATTIPEDLLDFANGKAELITPGWFTGSGAAWAAGTNGPLTRRLHDDGQWEYLARVVLNDKYGDDLRWYYLGRAAEGMALCDAAQAYYTISKQYSERFTTHCPVFTCYGFRLPEILEDRLIAVERMRSSGKCIVPPGVNQ